MTISQYIQCKLNQGALTELEAVKREQVEIAIGRFLHSYILPRISTAFVKPDMSLQKLHDEIALQQQHRMDAVKQLCTIADIISLSIVFKVSRSISVFLNEIFSQKGCQFNDIG